LIFIIFCVIFDREIWEWYIGKDLEGSSDSPFQDTKHLPSATEEQTENS
jgi:hypothetical protein